MTALKRWIQLCIFLTSLMFDLAYGVVDLSTCKAALSGQPITSATSATQSKLNLPNSQWGKLYFTQVDPHYFYRFVRDRYEVPRLNAVGEALALKDFELLPIVNDVEIRLLRANEFVEQFVRLYPERRGDVLFQELLDFHDQRILMIEDSLREIEHRIVSIDPELTVKYRLSWNRGLAKLHKIFERMKLAGSAEAMTYAERLYSQEVGFLGEVRSELTVSNISKLGFFLFEDDKTVKKIESVFDSFVQKSKTDFSYIKVLQSKYPLVFKSIRYTQEDMVLLLKDSKFRDVFLKRVKNAMRKNAVTNQSYSLGEETFTSLNKFFEKVELELSKNSNFYMKIIKNRYNEKYFGISYVSDAEINSYIANPSNAESYLNSVKRWIYSKEIDLMREPVDDGAAWVEVKNYIAVVDIDKLYQKGGKSILNQLQADLQIIDLMGMRGKIKLQFLSVSGITQEAKDLLQNVYKIEVLNTEVQP